MPNPKARPLRDKIARAVSESKLPGASALSDVIRTPEANARINDAAQKMVDNRIANERAVEKALVDYPKLETWFGKARRQTLPSGPYLIILGFLTFQHQIGDENMLTFLERYAVTDEAFETIMKFFCELPFLGMRWGYFDFENNIDATEDPQSAEAFAQLLDKELTQRLCLAVPGRWTYETLYREISEF